MVGRTTHTKPWSEKLRDHNSRLEGMDEIEPEKLVGCIGKDTGSN